MELKGNPKAEAASGRVRFRRRDREQSRGFFTRALVRGAVLCRSARERGDHTLVEIIDRRENAQGERDRTDAITDAIAPWQEGDSYEFSVEVSV